MSKSFVCLWLRVRWCLPWVNRGNDEIMKLNCGSAQLGDGRANIPPNWPYYIMTFTSDTVDTLFGTFFILSSITHLLEF